jgi:tetratricopeptide (TPR) repeat protein
MSQVGRNDPCPCGSGKKYKKCCLPVDLNLADAIDETHKTRAVAYKTMSEEKWEEAIELFRSVENDVPDAFNIHRAVAACYEALDDYLRAAEFYDRALATCPPTMQYDLTYQLGVARGCAGRYEKAADAFRWCLDRCQDPAHMSEIPRMLDTLERMQEGTENPNLFLVNIQFLRFFSDMADKRHQSAARRLEKLIPLDPTNPVIFYNLGVVYILLRREEDAFAQYEKAVELNPSYVQAWYNMGQICLIVKKDFSRALHCFDRALEIRPDYVGAHHQRGVAWDLLGDRDKALECWRKTLQLDPNNKMAKESIERIGKRASHESSIGLD